MHGKPFSVGPGWWSILEKYISRMKALDPGCEILEKEKYGTLRLHAIPHKEGVTWEDLYAIGKAAEEESAVICEFCGRPGSLRLELDWIKTLCDDCVTMGLKERIRTERAAAASYRDGKENDTE